MRVSIVWICLIILIGCGPTLHASVVDDTFVHTHYRYKVLSKHPSEFVLLGEEWKLDNLMPGTGGLASKGGPDYEASYYADADGDGEDEDLGTHYIYDLRYTHRRNAGVIWLRTVPLFKEAKGTELRVLARLFVDELAGTYHEVVQLGGKLYRTNKEDSYATKIVEEAAGEVAGSEAYSITLDVANVAQLELDPDARRQRVRIVLVRMRGTFVGRKGDNLPIVMLAGYSNLVEDFQGSQPAFDDFLGRIAFDDEHGARFGKSKKAPTPEQGAPEAKRDTSVDGEAVETESVAGETD